MDEVNLCRLCITSCNEFESLYDNNGQVSEFYEIAVKYFDPMLLNPGKIHTSKLLCLECWKHINDFYSYQQSIICAQSQLEHVNPIINVVKLNEMLPSPDDESTYEPFSVFDIIHINGENYSTKSLKSQVSLSDSVPESSKRDKNHEFQHEFNCEENNSLKRRKLKNDARIAVLERELECVECKETFANYTLLSIHFESAHPDKEWNVVCCDRQFNNRAKVIAHLRQFHNQVDENSYNCECCSASFSQYLSLKKHILKKHTAKNNCNYNSKSIKTQIPVHNRDDDFEEEHTNDLQENISIDSIGIDEKCHFLKESPGKERTLAVVHGSSIQKPIVDTAKKDERLFTTQTDSNINQSQHTVDLDKESNDMLTDSTDSSKKQSTLDYDNLIAKLKGDLECPNCHKELASYSLLKEHFIREHPNMECHIVCCKRKFFKCSKILTHLGQFHTRKDKNMYSCKMCGASFSQYGSLRRHIRRKHAVQSLLKWICNYCNGTFKTRSILERHKKKDHCKDKSKNCLEEHSEAEQSDETQEHIYCHSVVSKDKDDIYELYNETEEEPLVYIPNETPYSWVTSNDHIQQTPLEIVDVKDEILISSDNETVSNYPDNVTNVMNDSYCDTEQNILEYDDFIAKWKGNLKCPKCREIFANFSSLDKHFHNEHHIKNGCYIICCQTGLNDRRLIVEHLREHHKDPAGFRCDVCGKCFKSDRSLASHKRQVHIDKRSKYHLHLCYCKRTKDQDAKHKESDNDYKYDTVICCKRKQKTLEDDAIIAKWQQELKCRLCETTFPYFSLMHAHFYYEHPGERCYIICCERNLYRISDALEHIRIHLDPYAFKCELCSSPLAGKSSLSKHMRLIHGETSINKFACDQCNKSFSQSFILTRHKNVCHTTQDG